MAENIANSIARQLYAMTAKKKDVNLVENMRNERYQRTMTDEYSFNQKSRGGFAPHHRAQVYVGSDAPQYRKLLERANNPKTDKREYRYDENRGGNLGQPEVDLGIAMDFEPQPYIPPDSRDPLRVTVRPNYRDLAPAGPPAEPQMYIPPDAILQPPDPNATSVAAMRTAFPDTTSLLRGEPRAPIENFPSELGKIPSAEDPRIPGMGMEALGMLPAPGAVGAKAMLAAAPLAARFMPGAAEGAAASVVKRIGSDPLERALSSSSILHPDAPARAARSADVWDIGKELHARGQEALKNLGVESGVINESTRTPHTDEMLARVLAHETKEAIGRTGHAGDWYTSGVQDAMKTAALVYPEITHDPHAKFAITAAKAITSQGETVPSNVRLTDQVYQTFKQTGRFPTDVVALKGTMMNSNFAKLNKLLDELGPEGTREFMNSQFTVRDLEKMGYKISGWNKDTKVYGSAILGPKIGQGFFQNLSGNFNPVTTDLWFMRTWGRLTGTLSGFTSAVAKSRSTLEAALANAGQKVPKNINNLSKVADQIVSAHEKDFKINRALYDSGEKIKSPLIKAAERLQINLHGIKEQPSSGGERAWMAGVVDRARQLLEHEGHKITNADLQALIWYPEKDIYAKMGGRPSEDINVNYTQAWRDLARRKGVSDEAINAAVRPVE